MNSVRTTHPFALVLRRLGGLCALASMAVAAPPAAAQGLTGLRYGLGLAALRAETSTLPPRVGITGETPLSLDEAIAQALEHNKDLAVSRVAREQATFGTAAARGCAINLLAQIKAALGDLDKVVRVVRLGGFINSAPGPKVLNGASDLMVEAFGDKGRHARTTVGVASLPADAAVEVEGVFEVA